MLKLLVLIAAVTLSGCTIMSNRVACTVGKDKAFFISQYDSIGISAVIDDKDASVLCK